MDWVLFPSMYIPFGMFHVLVSLCILPLRAHTHMSPNILRYTGYSVARAKRDTRVKEGQAE